jgi:hypothetical protein
MFVNNQLRYSHHWVTVARCPGPNSALVIVLNGDAIHVAKLQRIAPDFLYEFGNVISGFFMPA